jgi:glucan phosphoethanolaminetransferase (alkaline phosphatase superfamily)
MLNWPHVHLIINHFPVVGILGVILLLAYAIVRKSEEVKLATLGLIVLLALMTIAVYLTGQAAEDTVKKLPGVTEASISRHEEVADLSLILMEASGVLALAGLFLTRRRGVMPKWLVSLVLILSLVTAVILGYTANLGGEIRHSEIRGPGAGFPEH